MPEEGVESKSHDEILSFEEMLRFVRRAVLHGISSVRITGGEPLVRKGVVEFVSALKEIEGVTDVSLTTNGMLLPRYAKDLKAAGLDRINISLDTLDPETYRRITRWGDLQDVLDAIEVAQAVGFDPIKINTVVVESLNQDLLAFAKLTLDQPLHVRFIEYMPVGVSAGIDGDGWTKDESVPSDEVLRRIEVAALVEGLGILSPADETRLPTGKGPARYVTLPDAKGVIGVISPLSNHFCAKCNRLRLTADGKLRPCLFSDVELDVRTALRVADMDRCDRIIRDALAIKPENHADREGTERKMSQIGG